MSRGIQTQGGSDRLIYDKCFYNQWLHDTTSPFEYMVYEGNHINNSSCMGRHVLHPSERVDIESSLQLRDYPASKCGSMKYNPNNSTSSCSYTPAGKPIIKPPYSTNQRTYNGRSASGVNMRPYTTTTEPSNIERFIAPVNSSNFQAMNIKCTAPLSTYDTSILPNIPPELCPIVHNNLYPKQYKGFKIPNYINCDNYKIDGKPIIM